MLLLLTLGNISKEKKGHMFFHFKAKRAHFFFIFKAKRALFFIFRAKRAHLLSFLRQKGHIFFILNTKRALFFLTFKSKKALFFHFRGKKGTFFSCYSYADAWNTESRTWASRWLLKEYPTPFIKVRQMLQEHSRLFCCLIYLLNNSNDVIFYLIVKLL